MTCAGSTKANSRSRVTCFALVSYACTTRSEHCIMCSGKPPATCLQPWMDRICRQILKNSNALFVCGESIQAGCTICGKRLEHKIRCGSRSTKCQRATAIKPYLHLVSLGTPHIGDLGRHKTRRNRYCGLEFIDSPPNARIRFQVERASTPSTSRGSSDSQWDCHSCGHDVRRWGRLGTLWAVENAKRTYRMLSISG